MPLLKRTGFRPDRDPSRSKPTHQTFDVGPRADVSLEDDDIEIAIRPAEIPFRRLWRNAPRSQPAHHFAADVLLDLTPFQRHIDEQEILVRRRFERAQSNRCSNVLAREFQIPTLIVDDAQHVTGIEVVGLGRDHGLIVFQCF